MVFQIVMSHCAFNEQLLVIVILSKFLLISRLFPFFFSFIFSSDMKEEGIYVFFPFLSPSTRKINLGRRKNNKKSELYEIESKTKETISKEKQYQN